jgi:cytochrome c2/uncharacterized membrane protein
MSLLLFKSILSLIMVLLAGFAIFTMFEILAREEKRFRIERLKMLHKLNGILYILIFLFISYFCLGFIVQSRSELTPRGTIHSLLSMTVMVLFLLKITILRGYRQYYSKVPVIGLLIALITFGMFGTSGGYYLLVSRFGKDVRFERIVEYKKKAPEIGKEEIRGAMVVRTDPASIGKGKNLFDSKCSFCHRPDSTETLVGPGLKGIMKREELPVSKRRATPENIANQLRNPYSDMPSFAYLKEEDVLNIIAYLNTL